MTATLTVLGAAQNVTGSRYLLDVAGKRILVDCGLYQERDLRGRNWDPFPVPPDSIDCILLTHAHLDHCGFLPRLANQGFGGPVYCTPVTAEVARIVMADSGHINEEDAARKRKRHAREKKRGPHPVEPLYTEDDAIRASSQLRPVRYDETLELGDRVSASFTDAGHILGSSHVALSFGDGKGRRRVAFSGDIGRPGKPILRDPTPFESADYVVVESTYGDRVHGPGEDIAGRMAEEIDIAHRAGGNVVIPTFAIERAHEVLYHLNELLDADRIPHLMVFVDSPMAIRVTRVFARHEELYDEAMTALVARGTSPFAFPGLKMTSTVDESKTINHVRGTAIVLAGSGMCTGGRVKHHLVKNITRPESTILFVGHQAVGTLGREIVDGAGEVRIFGRKFVVRARVAQITGFSGHADRNELAAWLSGLKTPPRRVFVTHGEKDSAHSFAELVRERLATDVVVPQYRQAARLD
jgi:metallo-beta-lactamase family protein